MTSEHIQIRFKLLKCVNVKYFVMSCVLVLLHYNYLDVLSSTSPQVHPAMNCLFIFAYQSFSTFTYKTMTLNAVIMLVQL